MGKSLDRTIVRGTGPSRVLVPPRSPLASRAGDSGLFALLCAINLLNYIDRQAITALLEPIRRDFGATDAQMGLVGVGFLATYAFLPPLFGWLGDRVPRTLVIAASAGFWSVVTAGTALVQRVWQLVALRAAVGVGEASYMANAPSLILDVFPPARRGRAMSVFYTASPVGAGLGVALGGVLAAHFGWRSACLMVGLPGLAAAWLMARRREPVRGGLDVAPPPAVKRSVRDTLLLLGRNRLFVLTTLAYGGMAFTQNAVEYWLPTVLTRDKALPLATASTMYGAAGLVAGICGPLIGAGIADLLKRRDPKAYLHVAAGTAALTVIPVLSIAMSVGRAPLFASVFGEAFLGNAAIGIIITLIVAAVTPEIRATATAVALTTVHLVGDIISQPLVGWISTALDRAGSASALWHALGVLGIAPTQHLLVALTAVVVPGALATGAMFLITARVSAPTVVANATG